MRDKLIELLTRKLKEIYSDSPATQIIALQIAGELLAAGMLSADLVRHGRWIEHTAEGENMAGEIVEIIISCNCSECGSDGRYRSNYCPNCGAKMDLEDAIKKSSLVEEED